MIGLLSILEEGLRAKPPRGDEHVAHCSDTICDLQTWARRKGEPMLQHDIRTLVKFELGHQFERGIGDVLEAQLSDRYTIHRDAQVSLNGIVGHADFVAKALAGDQAQDFVLEIKSTSFLRGKIPTFASSWYVEQAAMYAAACNISHFGILVGCRESGKIAPIFWFNLDDCVEKGLDFSWREWAIERARTLLEETDPQAFPPDPVPRVSWACRTCLWARCDLNDNPLRHEAVLDLEKQVQP